MSQLERPTRGTIQKPDDLLPILTGFYERLVELGRAQLPSTVPALKAVTLSTFANMRMQAGDADGEKGPRACIVTGGSSLLDGSEGVFAWDPTSTAADDNANTIQVALVPVGRWRRMV